MPDGKIQYCIKMESSIHNCGACRALHCQEEYSDLKLNISSMNAKYPRIVLPRFRQQTGSALLLVLALLVLILGLTLAFFSRAALQRQISSSSASNAQAGFLADVAQKVILHDIAHEIEAGSETDPLSSATIKIKSPRLLSSSTFNAPTAPSMRLQLVGNENSGTNPPIPSVLKVSRNGKPFFGMDDGYEAPSGFPSKPSERASAISTETASANQRKILKDRWNLPALMTAQELQMFKSPDWIYVDREGKNPTEFTAANLTTFSNAQVDNMSHVIGRFAYVIYDEGGLVDINMVGNKLPAGDNERKGRLHQVSLDPTGETPEAVVTFTGSNFSSFLDWRWPISKSNSASSNNGLFDPTRDFSKIAAGEQAFVNRQDLIRYAKETGIIPETILPYLTTASRDVNAPAYGSKESLALSNPPPATEMNPTLLHVRFPNKTTIDRPPFGDAAGNITVEAGTPVMLRRFPLSKIELLSAATPDADAIEYYFGLKKNSEGNWEYTADEDGRIAKLQEVATKGREPNFFEVLQAVIDNGSLGRNAGESLTLDNERDMLQNLQIIQIGANIIDQWDTDDTPTTLRYPSGDIGAWEDRYGIENLPYLNNILFVPHFPVYNRDQFQLWAVFDVWNPHQNATAAPQGITQLRIKATKGQPYTYLTFNSDYFVESGTLALNQAPTVNIKQNITDINNGKEFLFDAFISGGYVNPTVIGGERPTIPQSVPGILFADVYVGPAIVPSATSPATGTNAGRTWGELGFGTKAYNSMRIRPPNSGDPAHFVTLELQARVNNSWKTYQVIDEFMAPARGPTGSDTMSQIGVTSKGTEEISTIGINTYYQTPDPAYPTLLNNSFYSWRLSTQPTNKRGISAIKFDPRTIRFGHNQHGQDMLGTTLRQSTGNYNGANGDTTNFRIISSSIISGTPFRYTPPYLFEKITPNGASFARLPAFGFTYNSPDHLDNAYPARYEDPDGVIRPADGYLGALPTIPNRLSDRPVLLNRPFRSVGEMSYAFRDLPWKTIDFFTKQSGDLGLMDAFSVDESPDTTALVSGKVNLNTRRPEVLAALLRGSAQGVNTVFASGTMTSAEANSIANAIVLENTRSPFLHVGDVVSRALAPVSDNDPTPVAGGTWKPIIKTVRESAIRSLAGLTTTRTWNIMIDLVVQPGRFSPSAKSGADFTVKAERRYWIHLTIDRLTGNVIERKVEVVNE